MTTAPCPTCGDGKTMIVNLKEKEADLIDSVYPNVPYVPRSMIQRQPLTPPTMSVTSAFLGGCPDCGGSSTVKDASDLTSNIQAAKAIADSAKDIIAQYEAELGPPGGNRTTITLGNDTLQVGLIVNKVKSYKAVEGGVSVPSYVCIADKGSVVGSSASTYVYGTNPLSSPGGNYTLIVSNKMTITVGAQGLNINTFGELNISGGITKITGPQVTVGSSTGQLTLEGKHVQINGATIALCPTEGHNQVLIQGTLGVQSNVVVAGGVHVDGDISFTSGTCPSKIIRTKFAAAAGQSTGKTVWGTQAAMQAAKDSSRTIRLLSLDPSLIITSPRGAKVIMQKMQTIIYASIPLESMVTGYILPGQCVVVGSMGVSTNPAPIPIHNVPHLHVIEDGVHTHELEVPNIKLVDDDKEVRNMVRPKQEGVPVPASSEDHADLFPPYSAVGGAAN